MLTTRSAATEALEEALRDVDVDNPVAATRVLAKVARRFRPETDTEREAFKFSARQALQPFFKARNMDPAKAVAWAVFDGAQVDSGSNGHVSPQGEGEQAEWGEPISLGPDPPSDLSAEVLPSPLREQVESVASAKQVPTALSFALGLATLSTATAGKAEVKVRSGWSPEPLNVYTAVLLGSAERKSPVEAEMLRPVRDWERQREAEIGPERMEKLDRQDVLEKRLAKEKKRVANGDGTEEKLREIRDELRNLEVPSPPRLFTSDVTEEALGRLMAEQAGRAAILSSEGDVLRIFAGRYNSQSAPSIGLLKAAWSGDPYRVDRVGRDGVHLPHPLLTVGLTLQPTLLDTLSNRAVLDGEGVLARFLWVAPPSMIGQRQTGRNVPGLDKSARAEYQALIRRLLAADPASVDDDGAWRPHRLRLTEEAKDALYSWEAEVEELLAEGGELAPVDSWGGKLVGNTVRLAGLLHVAERAGQGTDPFSAPISGQSMGRAIQIARELIPHALHVLAGELELDSELELARYILHRIREAKDSDLTVRRLWHLTRGKSEIEETDDVRDVLDLLAAHNFVRVVEQPADGPGRPRSPLVRLNPSARDSTRDVTTMTRTEGAEEEPPESGHSGHLNPQGEETRI